MLITLTHTQLVLLSISNLLEAVLCLPRLCLPQGLEPTAKPPVKPAPKAAKPRAKPSRNNAQWLDALGVVVGITLTPNWVNGLVIVKVQF